MNLSTADIIVLITYLAGVTLMGVYFARKNTNTEEYFVGGRKFKGWVIGLSLVGTSISSISFLAYPGDAYKTAYLRMLPNFMLPIGVLVASYVFLPFFRRNRITSAYEYLEMRFGPGVRVYGSITFIAGQLIRISSILYLLALLLHSVTSMNMITCIIIGGIFVSFYTVLGGIDAVIWTDVIQTVVLAVGGLICLGVIINALPGGIGDIFTAGRSAGKFGFSELREGILRPVNWDLTLTSKTATMMLVIGLTNWLTEYSCNQNVVQRYAASRSTHDARVAMWVCALTSIPIWLFFMFLGTALFVFYQTFPAEAATHMLNGVRKAEDILPYFITNQLPTGMAGLVIAAALAAAMSSLDSSINAISTVSIIDIYRRHLVHGRDDKHYLFVARLIGIAVSILMIIGAIWLAGTETKTLQHTLTILGALIGGGLFGLFMCGMLTTAADQRAICCGIFCTLVFTGWTILSGNNLLPEYLTVPFDFYYTGVIGNIVMFVVGYIFGKTYFRSRKSLDNLTIWTYKDKTA